MEKEIYLDYSATTNPDEKVIATFENVARNYYANPNSLHKKGLEAKKVIDESIKNICDYLNISKDEIIFTSGASESNNFAIKGIISDRKEIITSPLEHSSIYGPISFLQKQGYKVSFVPIDNSGKVLIDELDKMINDNTMLVTIGCVSSELGTKQDIDSIAKVVKKHDGVLFHTDITQALGKVNVNLSNVDMASFSGHKLYGFKGIGALIKKENVNLNPLIHGGKSTSIYRSGTPQTALITSLSESFNIFKNSIDEKEKYVRSLNEKIRNYLSKYDNIVINSPVDSIAHILNISFIGHKASDVQKYFNDKNIYISTQTACAAGSEFSQTIYNLTNDMKRAESSVRISLSFKTTNEEIDTFLKEVDNFMKEVK